MGTTKADTGRVGEDGLFVSAERILPRGYIAIFALALAVRVLHALWLGGGVFPPVFQGGGPEMFLEPDSAMYLGQLETWLTEGGFVVCGGGGCTPIADRVPGYSLFLLAVHTLFGSGALAVVIMQSVLDAGTCAVVAMIGARFSPVIGWCAGIVAIFCMNLVLHSALILTDTLYVFVTTLGLCGLIYFWRSPGWRTVLLAGLALGLAVLVRPVGAPIAIVAVLVVLGALIVHRVRPAAFMGMAVLAAVTAVGPQALWMARNHATFGHFELVSQSGIHTLLWVVPLVNRLSGGESFESLKAPLADEADARIAAEPDREKRANPFYRSQIHMDLAMEKLSGTSPVKIAKAWAVGLIARYAIPSAALHPRVRALKEGSFINTEGASLFDRVRTYIKGANTAYVGIVGVSAVVNVLFLLAALRGLFRMIASHPAEAVLCILFLAYFAVVNGPILSPKYQLPIMPVLIVLAAYGLGRSGGAFINNERFM